MTAASPSDAARPANPKRLLGVRLVGLGRRWRKTLDAQLAAEGLSDAVWTPLVHLHRLGDGISQTELAAAVGLDGSSLVRLAAIEDELLADLDEVTARTLLQAFEQIEARIASAQHED